MNLTFLTTMVVLCAGGFGLSVYMGYWFFATIDALGGAIYWKWLCDAWRNGGEKGFDLD